MTLINPLEGNFFDNSSASNGRSKDPMEDIFGYSPYLGTFLKNNFKPNLTPNFLQVPGQEPSTVLSKWTMTMILVLQIPPEPTTKIIAEVRPIFDHFLSRLDHFSFILGSSTGSRTSPTTNHDNKNPASNKNFSRNSPKQEPNAVPQNNPPLPQNSRNRNLPDFGDRYSANRTKDRLRREQQKQQQKSQNQPQAQHQQGPPMPRWADNRQNDKHNGKYCHYLYC